VKRRHRKPEPPKRNAPRQGDQGLPPLGVLEEFTRASLSKWREAGRNLERLSQQLFFGLEAHRSQHSHELVDAIRASTRGPQQFNGWARLVGYQYTTQPLSMLGSTKGDGGRFNIGTALNPATYTPFPALYVAEDFPTAFRERFGVEQAGKKAELSANEIVLHRDKSFTQVALNVSVESVLDITDLAALKPAADILRKIQMPSTVGKLARQLHLRVPGLIRTPAALQKQLLSPDWRIEPVQYEMPSNSQIFGRLCLAAGVHAILYPSVRNSERLCLALFPQNWRGSASFVELVGPCPPEVGTRRLDGTTAISY
jgi:hypothetical protein